MLNNVADKIRDYAEDLIKDKRALIKILSIILILMLALVFKTHESGNDNITVEAVNENTETEEISEEASEVCIDIGGAVHSPGVYRVESGTRLYEVIALAGGLRSDADTNSVNQAAVVEDGIKIIIPVSSASNEEGNISASTENITVNASDSTGTVSTDFVNINTADKEQLKTLSGIGDVIADRILEYRSVNRFNKKEDIMSVKGVGSAIYEKIKDRIIV